jgi:hypothetical protein
VTKLFDLIGNMPVEGMMRQLHFNNPPVSIALKVNERKIWAHCP